jgi:hypothetical protein
MVFQGFWLNRRQKAGIQRLTRRQKPSLSPHFSDNLRHVSCDRRKNSRKTSERSRENGGNWRFIEGESAISALVFARE